MQSPEEMEDGDHEAIMDQVAMEAMNAIEAKDHDKYVDALHVLVGDLLNKMGTKES